MRLLLVIGAILFVIFLVWWDKTSGSRKRKMLYAIWNAAQNKKGKAVGVPVSLLDVIDKTNIPPTDAHTLAKKLASEGIINVSQHTVKFTKYGESYFKIRYLGK